MKRRMIAVLFALTFVFVSLSCQAYDDGLPPKAARNEFKAMYSNVRDVEWDREGVNWSVSYEIDRVEYESLYTSDGRWLMTQKEVSYSNVPQEIKAYLASSSEYGSLRLDDNTVEYFQTPSGNFYRFELESNGRDIEVDVSEDGTVSLARRELFGD